MSWTEAIYLLWGFPGFTVMVGFAVLNMFFDCYYFMRFGWMFVSSYVLELLYGANDPSYEHISSVIVTTNDLDHMVHMNNARYLRECDFNRITWLLRIGLYKTLYNKLRKGLAFTASTIRYRRSLNFLDTFSLKCKLVYWDEKAIYMEQVFSRKTDDFICAVMFSKYQFIGTTTKEVFAAMGYTADPPTLTEDLASWLQFNSQSSERYRPKTL